MFHGTTGDLSQTNGADTRRYWRVREKTVFYWQRFRTFYDRLKDSYDDRFYRQEVLGEYLNVQRGQIYQAFDRTKNVRAVELDHKQPLPTGCSISTLTSVLAGSPTEG